MKPTKIDVNGVIRTIDVPETPADIAQMFDLTSDRFKAALREIGEQVLPIDELKRRLANLLGIAGDEAVRFWAAMNLVRMIELGRHVPRDFVLRSVANKMNAHYGGEPREPDVTPYALAYKARVYAGIKLNKKRPKGGYRVVDYVSKVRG